MTIRFFVEKHIAKAVTTQLRLRGVEAIRAEDVGLSHDDDARIQQYVLDHRYTLVTGDEDFLAAHMQRQRAGHQDYGVVFVSPEVRGRGEAAIGQIVKELTLLHEAVLGGAASLEDDIYNRVYFIS